MLHLYILTKIKNTQFQGNQIFINKEDALSKIANIQNKYSDVKFKSENKHGVTILTKENDLIQYIITENIIDYVPDIKHFK